MFPFATRTFGFYELQATSSASGAFFSINILGTDSGGEIWGTWFYVSQRERYTPAIVVGACWLAMNKEYR